MGAKDKSSNAEMGRSTPVRLRNHLYLDAPVVRDAGAVVDALERNAAIGLGCDVADDVENGKHRLLVIGLAREGSVIGHGGRDARCESEELHHRLIF